MSQCCPMNSASRHIILIGLMGCGKTTIGRELQRTMDLIFSDTDQMIEEQEGMSIPAIFQEHGEAHFRNLETQVLRSYLSLTNGRSYVISTGGGMVLRQENRELLQQMGFVVWLNADVNTLVQRVMRSDNRPLLHHVNPEETLERLAVERDPLYAETAHLSIDTANLSVGEIAFGIMESARVFFLDKRNKC